MLDGVTVDETVEVDACEVEVGFGGTSGRVELAVFEDEFFTESTKTAGVELIVNEPAVFSTVATAVTLSSNLFET